MDFQSYYQCIDESKRLFSNKASSIEYIVTCDIIQNHLNDGMKILEIGAGSGAYSIAFAENGYDVCAVEPVLKNIKMMRNKISKTMKLEIIHSNHRILSKFEDNSFDLVLCLGPLYHLHDESEQLFCLKEAYRVAKKALFCAFINQEAVFVSESLYNSKQSMLLTNEYDPYTMIVKDDVFVFHDPNKIKKLFEMANIPYNELCGVDFMAECKQKVINELNEEQFSEWIRYALLHRNNPHYYGLCNHLLTVTEKAL